MPINPHGRRPTEQPPPTPSSETRCSSITGPTNTRHKMQQDRMPINCCADKQVSPKIGKIGCLSIAAPQTDGPQSEGAGRGKQAQL